MTLLEADCQIHGEELVLEYFQGCCGDETLGGFFRGWGLSRPDCVSVACRAAGTTSSTAGKMAPGAASSTSRWEMQGECSAPDQPANSNLKLQCPEGYAIGTMGVVVSAWVRGCASSQNFWSLCPAGIMALSQHKALGNEEE